ncbi:uncharacterized protein LOC143431486 [Xylocopa sonorina]|uniref:uncharacterized protein LOC143431486 n=1 Tax=Xylocopa sonorina TaxID=1818115 RepID=UPI00403A96E6
MKRTCDSEMKINEQLEIELQELERENRRLLLESANGKKLINGECLRIKELKAACEDLEKEIAEINGQHTSLLEQQAATCIKSEQKINPSPPSRPTNDDVTELLKKLQEVRNQRVSTQNKATELEQQLATLLEENNTLEEQLNVLRWEEQYVKDLQDERNTLEEVKRGQLCGRCLRGMKSKPYGGDGQCDSELSSLDSNGKGEVSNDLKHPCTLFKLPAFRRRNNASTSSTKSLQEELEMSGEFNKFPSLTSEDLEEQQKLPEKIDFPSPPTEISEVKQETNQPAEERVNNIRSGVQRRIYHLDYLSVTVKKRAR